MIHFESFTLSNGLQVIVHEDATAHIASINLIYKVGSKNERDRQTGFAHLFEHLMFSGSCNIPSYDRPLHEVGGDNNAYTTTDFTNYCCSIPADNLETAFWLESDRMLGLAFNDKSLEVQKKVVIEEFKEHYLNQPYGDVWHHLLDLAYTAHPYKWPIIGKELSHIEHATMEEVKIFFHKYYRPNNAILVVAGKVTVEQVTRLCKKWFEPIPAAPPYPKKWIQEPNQVEARKKTVTKEVPFSMLYKAYHMPGRGMTGYYTMEALCNLMGGGRSSLLYGYLVESKALFTKCNAYMTRSLEPGLFIISGRLADRVSLEEAESAFLEVIKKIELITFTELEKVKNQAEAQLAFSYVDLLNRTQDLAIATLMGDTSLVNREIEYIKEIHIEEVKKMAQTILQEKNCSTLYYRPAS